MDEISPLLAAEGFDLRWLGALDRRGFRTALANAVERINLEHYTAAGAAHAHALSLIGTAVRSMYAADTDALNRLIASINMEPQVADHVIGVCLGRLDSWHANPATQGTVVGTRASTVSTGLTNATRDILALASPGGHAFRSIDSLVVRHGSLTLLAAALFAVAATLAAWAEHDGADVDELIRRMSAGRI